MIIETALTKASSTAVGKAVKASICLAGKQVLEKTVKELLDKHLGNRLPSKLANLTEVQQSLFALELTSEEIEALEQVITSESFEQLIAGAGVVSMSTGALIDDQIAALKVLIEQSLTTKGTAGISALSAAIIRLVGVVSSEAWATAIELGLLGPNWSAEAAIQNLVRDQVLNAQRQVEECLAASAATLRDVDTFAARYKRAVSHSTSRIKPQSINDAPSVAIGEIYVEPSVLPISDKPTTACRRDVLLASSRRSVLLGNPGGGKSTLANKLCNDICSDAEDLRGGETPRLATLIILRDYAQTQKAQPCSIIEFLEIHSKSQFQVEAPQDAFKLLFLSGRMLVVFDGLDELIDIRDRNMVRAAVEHFALQYPITPILVTSREVGYEQAPLDRKAFNRFKLSAFENEQVETYSRLWFSYSCFPNGEEGRRLAAQFYADSEVVPDIRSNPLMLGLLCNLYKQDGFIPKNRPEVYQRCADLLFTKWDRSRGIQVKLPLDHRLRPAMSYLAHWIYGDESLQAGVTEAQLTETTVTYLRQWIEDEAEAVSIAQQFVDFFRGRAWVFTDTGADGNQRLYQFTHRTFLEFFTAEELVRLHPRGEDLHVHLIAKITAREWDVVCQLAYQLKAQRAPSQNTLVELLCHDAQQVDMPRRLNILSFLARTIDLLYPMPPARRRAVRLCIETVFRFLDDLEISFQDFRPQALEILGGVLGTDEEWLKINASEVMETIEGLISDESLSPTSLVLLLMFAEDLSVPLQMASASVSRVEARSQFWSAQSNALCERIADKLTAAAERDWRIAALEWWNRRLSLIEIVARFGAEALFQPAHYALAAWYRTPIARIVTDWLMIEPNDWAGADPNVAQLRGAWVEKESASVQQILMQQPAWSHHSKEPHSLRPIQTFVPASQRKRRRWPATPALSESVLLLFAAMAEYSEGVSRVPELQAVEADIEAFFNANKADDFRIRAHEIVDERCGSPEIMDRLHKWVEGNAFFTLQSEEPILEPLALAPQS